MTSRPLLSRLQRAFAGPPYSVQIASVRGAIGLGHLLGRVTAGVGVRPCGGCAERAERLDRILVFVPRAPQGAGTATASAPCWYFHGRCTGFGTRQCVEAPESQSPDAGIISQCCGGWFQYPWIEVCPGEPAKTGCGFCFW